MSNRHKWADVIHAFADGKEIQWRWIVGCIDRPWFDFCQVSYAQFDNSAIEWRVKPHKYQDVIDAYVRGETVQWLPVGDNKDWKDLSQGASLDNFDTSFKFRIKPDKYQYLRDAIAEGKTIQYKTDRGWYDVYTKGSYTWEFIYGVEYRIKPKPDITKTGRIYFDDVGNLCWHQVGLPNVKFTFDGETKELKGAEII